MNKLVLQEARAAKEQEEREEVMVFNEELCMWIRKEDDVMLRSLREDVKRG